MPDPDPSSGGDEWAFLCLDVSSTDALPSAQQCMRVLHISQARVLSSRSTNKCSTCATAAADDRACRERASTGGGEQGRSVDGADDGGPSSLCFRVSSGGRRATARRMLAAVRRGGNRLVLREWKGSASWWNLNSNLSLRGGGGAHRRGSDGPGCATLSMARAEVAGYRLARVCTADLPPSCADGAPSIPEVVCFSHDEESDVQLVDELTTLQVDLPWALMEYFDSVDDLARTRTAAHPIAVRVDPSLDIEMDQIVGEHQPRQTAKWTRCNQYPDTMVKVRHEFGFDEPHPRHGRVPENECFDYGMMVLRDAIVPIHCQFFARRRFNGNEPERGESFFGEFLPHIAISDEGAMRPFQYQDVVNICQCAFEQLASTVQDERMKSYVEMLGTCIDALKCEWDGDFNGRPPPLPAVLCHMDLQPQNLVFRRDKSDARCRVQSITDWEEACYADPRFELLLICRKVLAGPTQAEKLWQMYSDRMVEGLSKDLIVGPLDPWLRLETVHSICTLLLQASNLLGGGRNPWESMPELLLKIDRETRRLSRMGYPTCL